MIQIKFDHDRLRDTAQVNQEEVEMTFANTKATVYNDKVVRQFAIMTVVWGVVGMLVGVIIAAQLAWPELNLGIPCSVMAACDRCTPTR